MNADLEIRVPWWGWPLMALVAAGIVAVSVVAVWLFWAVLT